MFRQKPPTTEIARRAPQVKRNSTMAEKSQRGSNLTREDRERGGKASASRQVRDQRGQFAGARGKSAASQSSSSSSSHSSHHASSNQSHGQGRANSEQDREEEPDDGKQSGGPAHCDTNPDQ